MAHLKGIILDWAGTTVDFGCFAPTTVFIEGFQAHGVTITMREAREPMGKYKRDHIADLLAMPRIAQAWEQVKGNAPDDDDVELLFTEFIPRQLAVLKDYSALIDGVSETIHTLRARDLKIGSTTGYTRAMMEIIAPLAAAQGYAPDVLICPDDAPTGRPAPYMCWQNAMQMGIYPMSSMVKVGDTPSDMAEGVNAGMWTIGITKTGNEVGLSPADLNALSNDALDSVIGIARERLFQAGAHFVCDSVADILPLLDDIEDRLANSERP